MSGSKVYNLMSIVTAHTHVTSIREVPWEVPSSPVCSPSVTPESFYLVRLRISGIGQHELKSGFWSCEAWEPFPCAAYISSSWLLLLLVCILFLHSNIWIRYTLFIHCLDDGHLGFQIFWLLRVKPLWTFLYKSLCGHTFSFSWVIPRSKISGLHGKAYLIL